MRIRAGGRFAAAVLALALTVPAVAAAQATERAWYRSDALGSRLAQLDGPADTEGWVLEVERTEAVETLTLSEDGVERRSWRREYGPDGEPAREEAFESGLRVELSLYLPGGRIGSQEFTLAGGELERRVYEYLDGRLVSMEISVGDGPARVLRYLYGPDGRLLSVRESPGPDAAAAAGAGASVPGPSGSASWHYEGAYAELRRFDGNGRLAAVLRYQGTRLVSSERLSWDGELLATRSLSDLERGTETVIVHDELGRPVEERVSSADTGLRLIRRVWDAEDRLASEETESAGTVSLLEYAYDESGRLALERRLVDGKLVLSILYLEGGSRVEERYDGGVLFAREHWEGGRKVREEIVRDGVTVRERTFP